MKAKSRGDERDSMGPREAPDVENDSRKRLKPRTRPRSTHTRSDEDEHDDFGPTLPRELQVETVIRSANRSGTAIPSIEDLQLQKGTSILTNATSAAFSIQH